MSVYKKQRETTLGEKNLETLYSFSNLANLYRLQGRYNEALLLFKHAKEGYEDILSEDHPKALGNSNRLVTTLLLTNRFEEAKELLDGNLIKCKEFISEDPKLYKLYLGNLASFYSTRGDFKKAEPIAEKMLDISEQLLGNDHPDTIVNVGDLGLVYMSSKRALNTSEKYIKRAVSSAERVLGRSHPVTLKKLNMLGVIYLYSYQDEKAKLLFMRILKSQVQILGKHHPDTLSSMSHLGVFYNKQRKYEKAATYLSEALEISEKLLGTEHFMTAIISLNFGESYLGQGRYDDAERLLKDSQRYFYPLYDENNKVNHLINRLLLELEIQKSKAETQIKN